MHKALLDIMGRLQASESKVRRAFSQLDGWVHTRLEANVPGTPMKLTESDDDEIALLEPTSETSIVVDNSAPATSAIDVADVAKLRAVADTALRIISGRYHDVSMDLLRKSLDSLLWNVDTLGDTTTESTTELLVFRASADKVESIYDRNVSMAKRLSRLVTEENPLIREPRSPTSSMIVTAVRDTVDDVVNTALIRSNVYVMKDDEFDRLTDLMVALCQVDDDQATALAYRADEMRCSAFAFAVALLCYLSSCMYPDSHHEAALEGMVPVAETVHWLHQYFATPGDIADDGPIVDLMEHTCVFWGIEIPTAYRSFIHGCAYGNLVIEKWSQFNCFLTGRSLDSLSKHLHNNPLIERATYLDGKNILHFVAKVKQSIYCRHDNSIPTQMSLLRGVIVLLSRGVVKNRLTDFCNRTAIQYCSDEIIFSLLGGSFWLLHNVFIPCAGKRLVSRNTPFKRSTRVEAFIAVTITAQSVFETNQDDKDTTSFVECQLFAISSSFGERFMQYLACI